jgi:acyl carrier protein
MNESISSIQTGNINQEIRSFIINSFLSGQTDRLQDHGALLGDVIDSTGVLELVNFLQERFAITVEDEEVNPENLSSVNNLVAYVERKLNGRNA